MNTTSIINQSQRSTDKTPQRHLAGAGSRKEDSGFCWVCKI